MYSYTNRLIDEASPYLIQHAHNPVDWYPWGEEAFEKAKKEDKPLLVSIGYSACHWCHVMERESFDNAEVAAFMNQHFVNIKVDKEERPDVDNIFMDAVQVMTGSGGWPLHVFLLPDGRPFYGGTYFPPKRVYNRPSWSEILQAISSAYKNNRLQVEEQADNLTSHLVVANAFGAPGETDRFEPAQLEEAFLNLMKGADKEWGGFGSAPKFPQTFAIAFLLRHAHLTHNKEALEHALLSLDKMIAGGIYDHVGGGFARYSTDREWLVPHFEKMLYDNALLAIVLAEAYQATKQEHYKEVLQEVLRFVEREMMNDQKLFFSSLDADSEGEEGKFYVWDYSELVSCLKEGEEWILEFLGAQEKGNWEGKNILHTPIPLEAFCSQKGISPDFAKKRIEEFKKLLLERREKRSRPLIDDKVLLNWNALMNCAYSKAYAAVGDEHYKKVAISNMHSLLDKFTGEDGMLFHSWRNGKARHSGFLDDYSFTIAALIELGQVTADFDWLTKALKLTELVMQHFADEKTPFFFYTKEGQIDVLFRKKEVYDAATPSGNSMMALNLLHLGVIWDNKDWKERAVNMILSFNEGIIKYPASFGVWLIVQQEITYGINELAIIGPDADNYLKKILRVFIPNKIVMSSVEKNNNFPLLREKWADDTLIYLCRNYTCTKPVRTVEEMQNILNGTFF